VGERLGIKLAHHEGDLTSMVNGMVRQMLHQVRQAELRGAKRKHSFQGFAGQAIQNPVVRPAVVFEEQLNVIFGHGD